MSDLTTDFQNSRDFINAQLRSKSGKKKVSNDDLNLSIVEQELDDINPPFQINSVLISRYENEDNEIQPTTSREKGLDEIKEEPQYW